MTALTEPQIAVLEAVRDLCAQRSYGPSFEEIAELAECSTGYAQKIALSLVDLGYLTRTPKVARSLRPVEQQLASV